ncbi:MAG: cell division protein FtsZ, partial [Bacteroidia bacterium]
MKNQGIRGVDFIICNTDGQALAHSPVETKIQLGAALTEGLGAGANPEVGEQAALESYAEIQAALGTQTKMVFITAGMGGGTGTGAAPIIAKAARELGILTVGIVTAPFAFEGNMRLRQAEHGIERLREHVDSLIVINNNKLREVYGNLGFKQGFMKADEVLSTAARGIAEVITHHYSVNIDLRDAKTVLHNSGTAIMGSAKAAGSTRALSSVRSALDSPLLNDNHIEGARYVLLLIVSGTGEHEVTLDEIGEINDYIQEQAGRQVDIIMGIGEDAHLADALQVTVIATGFNATNPIGMVKPAEPEKVVYELRPDSHPGSQFNLFDEPVRSSVPVELVQSPVEVPISEIQTPMEQATDLPLVEDTLDSNEATEFEASKAGDLPIEEPKAFEVPIGDSIEDETTFDMSVSVEIESEAHESPSVGEVELDEMTFELNDSPVWALDEPIGEVELVKEDDHIDVNSSLEDGPTMTWTLDWNGSNSSDEGIGMSTEEVQPLAEIASISESDVESIATQEMELTEPDALASAPKSVGLDELLAFEAQLRGDVDGPSTPLPSEASSVPAAINPSDAFDSPVGSDSDIDEPLAHSDSESHSLRPAQIQHDSSEIRVEVRPAVEKSQPAQIDPDRDSLEETMRRMAQERRAYLQAYSHRFGQTQQRIQEGDMDRPAFERQGWNLDASTQYSKEQALGEHMVRGEKNEVEFRPHNSFLHDNVD